MNSINFSESILEKEFAVNSFHDVENWQIYNGVLRRILTVHTEFLPLHNIF